MPPPTQVVKKKVLPDRKNRGKNRKYKYKYHTPTPERRRKLQSDWRPQEIRQKDHTEGSWAKEMASNPPSYVKIFNMVKCCSGCRLLFDDKHRKPPNDLVFRYRMRREYPDPVKQGPMEGSRQDRKCLLSLSGSSLSSQRYRDWKHWNWMGYIVSSKYSEVWVCSIWNYLKIEDICDILGRQEMKCWRRKMLN